MYVLSNSISEVPQLTIILVDDIFRSPKSAMVLFSKSDILITEAGSFENKDGKHTTTGTR